MFNRIKEKLGLKPKETRTTMRFAAGTPSEVIAAALVKHGVIDAEDVDALEAVGDMSRQQRRNRQHEAAKHERRINTAAETAEKRGKRAKLKVKQMEASRLIGKLTDKHKITLKQAAIVLGMNYDHLRAIRKNRRPMPDYLKTSIEAHVDMPTSQIHKKAGIK